MVIKLPAYFTGFGSKSDGSASLRFNTQEIDADTFAELKRHHNAFGWLVFGENATEEDIPDENVEEEGISSSERLRRVLFVYWKQKNIGGDFELWRRQYIEKLIDNVKDKLN